MTRKTAWREKAIIKMRLSGDVVVGTTGQGSPVDSTCIHRMNHELAGY